MKRTESERRAYTEGFADGVAMCLQAIVTNADAHLEKIKELEDKLQKEQNYEEDYS